MQLVMISALVGAVGGAVLGYWLATHIHSVAAKAAATVTDATAKLVAATPVVSADPAPAPASVAAQTPAAG
jgi:ABC-type lipoprotein release transport system permease subunit